MDALSAGALLVKLLESWDTHESSIPENIEGVNERPVTGD